LPYPKQRHLDGFFDELVLFLRDLNLVSIFGDCFGCYLAPAPTVMRRRPRTSSRQFIELAVNNSSTIRMMGSHTLPESSSVRHVPGFVATLKDDIVTVSPSGFTAPSVHRKYRGISTRNAPMIIGDNLSQLGCTIL
jgi:hypothetical protein